MIKLTLLGTPLSTNNVYRKNGRTVYMTPQGKSLKYDYYLQLKQQFKDTPITGDVKLTVDLYFGDKKIRDIDNYNKLLLDACTGVLWDDDSQIQSITIRKNYDKLLPRIELAF